MTSKNKLQSPFSVIILAAGNSSRMQSPKFALKYDENYTFLEKIIESYTQFGCQEIIVVLNNEGIVLAKELYLVMGNARLILNKHPEWERFYSVKLGLESVTSKHPVFIHNVDNPFVSTGVLKKLLLKCSPSTFVVPVFKNKGGHPIIISHEICQAIRMEQNHAIVLSDFLKKYEKRKLNVDNEFVLTNINTKNIYKNIFGRSF